MSENLEEKCAYLINGVDLLNEYLERNICLPTGIESIDKSLHGGIFTSELTEIISASPSACTDLCCKTSLHTAAIHNSNTFYIDSCNVLNAKDLQEIVLQMNTSTLVNSQQPSDLLRCIRSSQVTDVYSLLNALHYVKVNLSDGTNEFFNNLRLLVVDSVVPLLADCVGGKQSQGYYLLSQVGRELHSIATDHDVAVLVVNGTVRERNNVKPMLGRSWRQFASTRILLEADSDDCNVDYTVIKSSHPRR